MVDRRQFRIADIAAQARLSPASVDRVLHARLGVRPETVAQVERAIHELERQRTLVQLSTSTFLFDLVMQAPRRFSGAFVPVLERELRELSPAVARVRVNLQEQSDASAAAAILSSIAQKGSHGVIVKAPDHPTVAEAIDELAIQGIPCVTFATDVHPSGRVAYVGVDNRSAGATAAYLLSQWVSSCHGVLVISSNSSFSADGERFDGFRRTLAELAPDCPIHRVLQTDGLDDSVLRAVREELARSSDIEAVYSVGGGNVATIGAFAEVGRPFKAFIAHDLDRDNRWLLRRHEISAVLHHDLRADARSICSLLLRSQTVLRRHRHPASTIQVVTPYNEPVVS